MGRRRVIVVSMCQNISGNRAGFDRHFATLRARPGLYSGRMESPALPSSRPGLASCRASSWRAVVALLAGLLWSWLAQADEAGASLDTALETQVRQLALQGVRPDGNSGVRRVELSVGRLDPRLHLAPCQHIEPYLPSGVRLWGKTRIGLRCTQGAAAWNVFLPITVKVYGMALVAAAVLPAGSVLARADLAQAEVDLAEDPSMALNDTPNAIGRTLQHALLPGQSLRQAHLKPRQWFAPGDIVQVFARGDGFSVASAGEALTAGIEGQSARVRTESGRVLVGLPVAENRVELSL